MEATLVLKPASVLVVGSSMVEVGHWAKGGEPRGDVGEARGDGERA